MKNTLIRIHSLNNNGLFDTMFNEEIVIKENSSIALQQLSFNRAESQLIINGENDTITFQVETATGVNDQDGDAIGGSHIIRLTHKTYTRESLSELLQEISDEMNKKLNSYADSENGTNIRWSINLQGRVEIEFMRTILHYVAPQYPNNGGADHSYKQGATMAAADAPSLARKRDRAHGPAVGVAAVSSRRGGRLRQRLRRRPLSEPRADGLRSNACTAPRRAVAAVACGKLFAVLW